MFQQFSFMNHNIILEEYLKQRKVVFGILFLEHVDNIGTGRLS